MQIKPTHSNTLPHLDLLRFIASVGIIFHHSLEFFFKGETRVVSISAMQGLAMFVDLFFVISGFVIAYVYSDRITSLRNYGIFMQRRVARLVPLHWLTMLIAMMIYATLYVAGIKGLNHTPSFRPDCVAETALLVQSLVDCGEMTFNGQSWSISAEMVMYLTFPVYAFAGRKHSLLPLMLCALALAANVTRLGHSTEGWLLQPSLYRAFPSFLLGVGLFYNRSLIARLPCAGVIAAIATVITLSLMLTGATAYSTLIGVYVIVISAVAADEQQKISPITAKLAPLGQLTYSMYMLHGLFIMLIMNALGDKLLHLTLIPMIALSIFCYAAILIASYISYNYFETPARRKMIILQDLYRIFISELALVTHKTLYYIPANRAFPSRALK